jgi:hypothetical protein
MVGGARVMVTRLGAIACVAMASLLGAGRLDDAVAVFDFRADANGALTFNERTYPESAWVAGSARVLNDARLWIPKDSKYRVIRGPDFSLAQSSGYGRYFLLGLLLPRMQTDSDSAAWVLCYGCGRETLGDAYQVLSDSGDGFLLARRRS